jgi:hypothetical protein
MIRAANGWYIIGSFLNLPVNYWNFGNFQGMYGILSDDIYWPFWVLQIIIIN